MASLRGGRRRLGFGISTEDIEDAMKDIEDVETELLEEMYGVDVNYAESMSVLECQMVCPVCQVSRMEETGPALVRCRSQVSDSIHNLNLHRKYVNMI